MPKYLNSGTTVIEAGGVRFEPNVPVETYQWIPVLPTDLTKVSDSPYLDPILLSKAITSTSTETLATTITGNYKVVLYCSAGAVSYKFNSDSATARVLGAGESDDYICLSRTINDIRFTISSGTVYLTIRKI